MAQPLDIELTAADIVTLTDLIYESVPEINVWSISADDLSRTVPTQPLRTNGFGRLLALAQNQLYASPCSTA